MPVKRNLRLFEIAEQEAGGENNGSQEERNESHGDIASKTVLGS